MSDYHQLEDGEPLVFNPQKMSLKMACCDCGLVHTVEIKVAHRQKVTRRAWRANRATGQKRRQKAYRAKIVPPTL